MKTSKHITAKSDALAEDWIERNGCASFGFEDEGIHLHDGGLFYIDTKSKMVKPSKTVLDEGTGNYIFKEIKGRRKEKMEYHTAVIWFQDLDDSICYLRRMKRFLNGLGYQTGRSKNERR